jgi:hypothetical protein
MGRPQSKTSGEAEAIPMPPGPIAGPSAWYGRDLKDRDDWIFRFSPADLAEIEAAVQATLSVPIKDIDRAQFRLPKLGPRLKKVLAELLDGRGFVLMRGLPVDYGNIEHVARAYWGIGAHLGGSRSQNARGDLLGHVIDLSRSVDDPTARIYQTSARQNYHADSTDLVGLLCLQKSMSGGASSILSSVTIYNEMLARRPDLARELFFPFYVDRRGEVPDGKEPWYRLPVFSWYQGLLTVHFTRPYIDSAQRLPGVPRLTDKQIAALDLFLELCEDPDIHLNMDFEPGDIQFLQNYQVLHDRTAFQDWPGQPERRRHLLRLWLCTDTGRELPPAYLDRQESIAIGDRGGIVVPGLRLNVNLEPG